MEHNVCFTYRRPMGFRWLEVADIFIHHAPGYITLSIGITGDLCAFFHVCCRVNVVFRGTRTMYGVGLVKMPFAVLFKKRKFDKTLQYRCMACDRSNASPEHTHFCRFPFLAVSFSTFVVFFCYSVVFWFFCVSALLFAFLLSLFFTWVHFTEHTEKKRLYCISKGFFIDRTLLCSLLSFTNSQAEWKSSAHTHDVHQSQVKVKQQQPNYAKHIK